MARCVSPSRHCTLEQLCGLPVRIVWRPLPVVGKLDHTMPRGPACLVPSCAGLPDVQARLPLEPVQGSPFTRGHAHVLVWLVGPVHVWARPLILDGEPVRPLVLLWKSVAASAVCWLGCPRGTPAKCQVPILPTVLPRLLSSNGRLPRLLAAAHDWPMMLYYLRTLVGGCLLCHCAAPMPCRPAWEVAALPPLAIGGHLDVAELAGAALHLPAAALQLSPSPLDYVGPCYGIGLRLVPSLGSLWPTVWPAVMDAFWTPFCRSHI